MLDGVFWAGDGVANGSRVVKNLVVIAAWKKLAIQNVYITFFEKD